MFRVKVVKRSIKSCIHNNCNSSNTSKLCFEDALLSRLYKLVVGVIFEYFCCMVRDKCLNDNWFLSLEHALTLVAAWREDFNTHTICLVLWKG
jgi:hypothetical protein